MDISLYLKKECILIKDEVKDKKEVLEIIAKIAKKSSLLERISEKDVFEKLFEREKITSTGFENHVAIPHCALPELENFVVGVLIVKKGVDFKSIDGKLTKLFAFIIAPACQRNQHIRCLSAISTIFHTDGAVEDILNSMSEEEIFEKFIKYGKEKIDKFEKNQNEYSLIYAIIQKEEKFEDILNIFTEVEDCHISVIEANDAGKFLYALPLFHSFWSDKPRRFNRIIMAAVNKAYANELIRKLNLLIEKFKKENNGDTNGILILMQNVVYLNGALDI